MCPDFFFHMYFVVERCAASRSAASVWQASWGDITSLYIYHIIIIIGCLLTSNSQDILAMGEDLLSQEPSVLEPGMRSVSGFLPILTYRDNNTHNSPKTHPHLYFYSFTADCPKMVMERERERKKTHHRKHWSCLYSPHLEIHQHCLFSILFCATLWPSPQELRGSITLCGAILGDLQHLQNLRHVITAQPGTGLLFLGITWRRRRKTKWRQEDKREELWCWTGVGDGMYSCGGLGRQYDASNVISKEAKALGFC